MVDEGGGMTCEINPGPCDECTERACPIDLEREEDERIELARSEKERRRMRGAICRFFNTWKQHEDLTEEDFRGILDIIERRVGE